jgi:hypothetical protein
MEGGDVVDRGVHLASPQCVGKGDGYIPFCILRPE